MSVTCGFMIDHPKLWLKATNTLLLVYVWVRWIGLLLQAGLSRSPGFVHKSVLNWQVQWGLSASLACLAIQLVRHCHCIPLVTGQPRLKGQVNIFHHRGMANHTGKSVVTVRVRIAAIYTNHPATQSVLGSPRESLTTRPKKLSHSAMELMDLFSIHFWH